MGHSLTFSPNRYWLCAASGPSIKVWDLESKNLVEDDLRPEIPGSARTMPPQVTSLAWSADGQTLFAGYTDNASESGRFPWLDPANFCLDTTAPDKNKTINH